ncbi:uncharacterized protein MYCFIDRAFT_171083 [Pseudocercospora fijiensis CIRAD86]|uniref:F-box domain-containing protein n=1 Tax=Pseudocercospora fijiensis (strain CIRAD86) TaxID=383855 RepID=N1QBU4_PSEFD|nr:uncharacterized protein MYCFIDRAFT_171083 [Pseudocercospora fijiensis CIRAD86]EME89661.1 hypothetical protein MYCFIDRAFT_171083 [Pseudocercospora fijiensis CIRAD86]
MEPMDKRSSKAKLEATAAARQAVFDTAELLENIFLLLPPQQALVAQSVCQQFRTIVATSPALQEMLFLTPSNKNVASERWAIVGKDREDDESWFKVYEFAVSPIPSPDTEILAEGLRVVTQNPMITIPTELRVCLGRHACAISDEPNQSEMLLLPRNIRQLILRPKSKATESWQHMNITDPPCTSATLQISVRMKDKGTYLKTIEITACDRSGITMNKLLNNTTKNGPDSMEYEIKIWESIAGSRHPVGQTVRQILDDMSNSCSHKLEECVSFMYVWIPRTVAATEEERDQVHQEFAGRKDDGTEAQ